MSLNLNDAAMAGNVEEVLIRKLILSFKQVECTHTPCATCRATARCSLLEPKPLQNTFIFLPAAALSDARVNDMSMGMSWP